MSSSTNPLVQKCDKMTWREMVSKDLQVLNINADLVSHKAEW